MENYTLNEWETTLGTSGEDVKLHSKRVENSGPPAKSSSHERRRNVQNSKVGKKKEEGLETCNSTHYFCGFVCIFSTRFECSFASSPLVSSLFFSSSPLSSVVFDLLHPFRVFFSHLLHSFRVWYSIFSTRFECSLKVITSLVSPPSLKDTSGLLP